MLAGQPVDLELYLFNRGATRRYVRAGDVSSGSFQLVTGAWGILGSLLKLLAGEWFLDLMGTLHMKAIDLPDLTWQTHQTSMSVTQRWGS